MNSLYIGVGLAVILALVTALIGPFFVDWGAHRAVLEAEASRVVGLPVHVLGDVDVRLLPSPRLRAGDVVIGGLDRPVARIGRFEADLDVAGLVRGEVRVVEATLDRPALSVELDADGRVAVAPERGVDVGAVGIETLRIVDGRFDLADARSGGRFSVDRIEGKAGVDRLAGPWRLDATGRAGAHGLTLRVAGRPVGEGTGLRGSLVVDEAATLAGDLSVAFAGGRPSLVGTATLERRAEGDVPAATVAAKIAGDAGSIRLDELVVTSGDEAHGLRFEGSARVGLGAAPEATVTLAARRLDLDPPQGAPRIALDQRFARALGALAGATPTLAGTMPVTAAFTVETAALGGGVVSDVALALSSRPGGMSIERFSARLPGDTRLSFAGRLGLDDVPTLAGSVDVETEAPERLAAWWTGEPAGETAMGPLRLTGPFRATATGFVGEQLALTYGGATAHGRIERSDDGALRLALAADRLDGDALLRLARRFGVVEPLRAQAGRGALAVDFDARAVTLGGVVARGAHVAFRVSGDEVAIDDVTVSDLGGARIAGGGRVAHVGSKPEGRLDLGIAAEKPAPLVRALAAFLGDERTAAASDGLGRALGPIDLKLGLVGTAAGDGDVRISLGGRAAGGTLAGDGRWQGRVDDPRHGRAAATLRLDGARADPVLVAALGAGAGEKLALAATAEGRAVDGLRFDATASLGERRMRLSGTTVAPEGAAAATDVVAEATAPDLSGLGGLVGLPGLAFERRLPVSVRLEGRAMASRPDLARLDVSRLDATVGEARADGNGRLERSAEGRWRFDGRVHADKADLDLLVAALVGDGTTIGGLLDLDVAASLTAPVADDTAAIDEAKGRLVVEQGAIRVEDLAARIGEAGISGTLRARRGDDGPIVSGRLRFEGARIGDAAAPNVAAPAVAGPRVAATASGEASFETHGRDAAARIAHLAGSGHVVLEAGRLDGISVEGLRLRHDDAVTTGAATAARLAARMAGTATALPRIELPFVIDGGVAATVRNTVEAGAARLDGRVAVDLATREVSGKWAIEPAGEATRVLATPVSGALPSLDLTLSGPVGAPRFAFDTASFDAFQSLRKLEREIEEADTLRQDQIERARFARILRRLEEARRAREAEAAAKAAATSPGVVEPGPAATPTMPIAPMPPAPTPVAPALTAPMPIVPTPTAPASTVPAQVAPRAPAPSGPSAVAPAGPSALPVPEARPAPTAVVPAPRPPSPGALLPMPAAAPSAGSPSLVAPAPASASRPGAPGALAPLPMVTIPPAPAVVGEPTAP